MDPENLKYARTILSSSKFQALSPDGKADIIRQIEKNGISKETIIEIMNEIEEQTPSEPDRFKGVPIDVIRVMGLNMDLDTLNKTCQVSKRFWRILCNNEDFWREKVRKDYGQIIEDIKQDTTKHKAMSWLEYYQELYTGITTGLTTFQLYVLAVFLTEVIIYTPEDVRNPVIALTADNLARFLRKNGLEFMIVPGNNRNWPHSFTRFRVIDLLTNYNRVTTDKYTYSMKDKFNEHRGQLLDFLRPFIDRLRNHEYRIPTIYRGDIESYLDIILNGNMIHNNYKRYLEGYVNIFRGSLEEDVDNEKSKATLAKIKSWILRLFKLSDTSF